MIVYDTQTKTVAKKHVDAHIKVHGGPRNILHQHSSSCELSSLP